MAFSTTTERSTLGHWVGKTSLGTAPQAFAALFTGSLPSAGGVECTGGSYARVATVGATWNAPGGANPASVSNAQDITFPTPTADWAPAASPAVSYALYTALTAGVLIAEEWLGNYDYQPFNATDLSTHLIASEGHGFIANNAVIFTAKYGGTLPTGIAENTIYWVLAAGLTVDLFAVSATVGGTAVNYTVIGKGSCRQVDVQTILNGASPVKFAGGAPGAAQLFLT